MKGKKILGIPIALFLIGLFAIDGASAALLTYLGRVQTNINESNINDIDINESDINNTYVNETDVNGTDTNGTDLMSLFILSIFIGIFISMYITILIDKVING